MVDFNKLKAAKTQPKAIDPLEIFRRLPKPIGINDLYTSQAEVLKEWFGRRKESDLVIKLHTGGGKTLVGLLIAQSVMSELNEPVIYVCPTVQLIQQTLEKAKEYGIPAVPYKKGEMLPREFTSGKKVLVCNYNALFNAKSKFGIRGGTREIVNVGAVILDDAHVAYSTMRNAYTLNVEKEKSEEDYLYLANLFRKDFDDLGKIGTFDDIISKGDFGVIEVPYWSWKEKSSQVRAYLQKRAEKYPMVWDFLRDSFDYCHCIISKDSLGVTPIFPIVDLIPTFSDSPRRIYMSATISDDSMIVRSFNADKNPLSKPIISNSLAGVSERMILVPELMPSDFAESVQFIKRLANWMANENKLGTVILTPSIASAKEWIDIGTIADSTEKVSEYVKNLQEETQKGPYIFVNRYDGIDLPNNACRLLIMAGLPRGANSYDSYRSSVFLGGEEFRSSLAQRIEQGIGRGARGGGDYCIVILTGYDISAWIDRPDNQNFLTSSTRAQISIGKDVSSEIKTESEFTETIVKCLKREEDWTKYHAETLAELVQLSEPDEKQLQFAAIERKAFELLRQNLFDKAIEKINKYLGTVEGSLDKQAKGWLEQLAARISYYSDNKILSSELQESAYFNNENLHRPLIEPEYIPIQLPQAQTKAIVAGFNGFSSKKGLLSYFENTVSFLTQIASSNQFEDALAKLGIILGFATERPDNKYKKGPDILWLLDNENALVMEAKSKKLEKNPLDKYEHGQLLQADEWFKKQYPKYSSVRVSVHPNRNPKYEADTNDTRVLTFEKLNELIFATRKLLVALNDSLFTNEQLEMKCEELLKEYKLTPDTLPETFLESFLSYDATK